MKRFLIGVVIVGVVSLPLAAVASWAQFPDIRGPWVGKAKGTIIGAEGSVFVTHQQGEDVRAVVEGSNFFGTARFNIACKVRGNQIFGSLDGHSFQGFLYMDGTIRGTFRAVTGDTFEVILQRPYQSWGMRQPGGW
jgi:hypothetical protein